jgi:hypothetical protein
MTAEEQIRILSERVTAAPEGSEELALPLVELRAALKASSGSRTGEDRSSSRHHSATAG